uniref:EPS8 signaling adaptor L3b n=1 Tax=Scleropages formosus TaxID=113540 RepID=A0A8C9RXN9_SCLFO
SSRPSGKTIYLQRKEYAESMNRQPDNFQYRVQHLFTLEMDGQQVRGVDDCVARLKQLDARGRVWAQDMILEARGVYLQLSDIETKEELETLPLARISDIQAVLDSCTYNSLLMVAVQEGSRSKVFMFQCEEVGVRSHVQRSSPGRGRQPSALSACPLQPVCWTSPGAHILTAHTQLGHAHDTCHTVRGDNVRESPPRVVILTVIFQEIFNHIVADLELFMEKVSAAIPMQVKGKKSKQKKGVVSHCPPDLPPSVLIPLLTESTLRLMAQEVTPEEDQLWQSLGDAWNIPRSKWPDGDLLPPYVPEFYDGWRPPSPVQALPNERFVSRSSSQRNQPEQSIQQRTYSNGPSIYMRVMYDFMARNPQELSVMKGEMVQVLDQSRQWWLVRNNSNQEGHVPHNLLEPLEGDRPPEQPAPRPSTGHQSPPSINMMSSPNDVKAWLEYKGFSQITVRSLGTLTGALLLGMTRDELRAVCPEEGGRVFFHLQGVKSALALASENGFEAYRGR